MRSDLSRVAQRLHAAETSSDLVGRGTVAARGRGRAGRPAVRRPSTASRAGRPTRLRPRSRPARGRRRRRGPPSAREPRRRRRCSMRWRRRSATPTRAGSAPRSGGSRRSVRIPTSTRALLHYRPDRSRRATRRGARAPRGRAITDVVRAHVSGVRAAISAGRWREAQELLRTLERDVPPPDDAAAGAAAGGRAPATTPPAAPSRDAGAAADAPGR